MKRDVLGLAAVLLAACAAPAAWAQGESFYKVSKSVPLNAPDRWDYVVFEPTSHRVFVAHGDRLSVVDGRTGARLGEVTGMPGGVHGIAISVADGRGYTDDGKAGKAVSFDLKTLKVEKILDAAPDADAVARDPVTGHVFIINGDTGTITVIDPRTDTVIATIQGGGKLEYAVADGAGKLYVNGAGNREILRVNTNTNQVDARWAVPECESPHGLAIDIKGRRLFTSCMNAKLIVFDIEKVKQVATLPIGRGTDAAAYDPVRHRVFSSNGLDGTLTVIAQKGADDYSVVDTIKTAVSARTMGIDQASGRLYLASADADPATPAGARPKPLPGTLKLLFLDPVR